jgi:acetoin utilization deacetylase AcuC-like enzyme
MDGLARRDALVLGYAQRNQIPVAITLAGGYARKLEDTVSIHVNTIKAAIQLAQKLHARPASPSS